MPLYEGLGSGGEKTAVVIDLGEAFTKWVAAAPAAVVPRVGRVAEIQSSSQVRGASVSTFPPPAPPQMMAPIMSNVGDAIPEDLVMRSSSES